jgi:protoporphyrinogen oxidase
VWLSLLTTLNRRRALVLELSGQRYEAGPRSFLMRGKDVLATDDLIHSLGLECEVLFANRASSSRYVILNGAPTCLPKGLFDLIGTPLGSELGKKIVREPFLHGGNVKDESVACFFTRRAPHLLLKSLPMPLSVAYGEEIRRRFPCLALSLS